MQANTSIRKTTKRYKKNRHIASQTAAKSFRQQLNNKKLAMRRPLPKIGPSVDCCEFFDTKIVTLLPILLMCDKEVVEV